MNALAMIRTCGTRQAVTQAEPTEVLEPAPEINHEPLACVSDYGLDGVDRHSWSGMDDAQVSEIWG